MHQHTRIAKTSSVNVSNFFPRPGRLTAAIRGYRGLATLHWNCKNRTEKTEGNLVNSNPNQIVFNLFRSIWIQMDVCLVPNISENGKYNLILVDLTWVKGKVIGFWVKEFVLTITLVIIITINAIIIITFVLAFLGAVIAAGSIKIMVLGKFFLRKFHPGKFHLEISSYGKFLLWKKTM